MSDKLSIHNVKPKMKFEGKVTKLELAGAHVDVGAERDAYLHISELQPGKVALRVADHVKEGDVITVWVKYVKPDEGLIALTRIEPPALEWSDLQRGLRLTGKIIKIENFGAFVNIGAPKDGMVPVNAMSKTRINTPADVVKEGQEVTVWVTNVSRKENKIGLSMMEPPKLDWKDIKRGQMYTGKVTRLDRMRAFIDIGAEREASLHLSEMGAGFVDQASDVLKVGEEVEARVIEVDAKKRMIRLTTKVDIEEAMAELAKDEDQTPVVTPMEAAFKAAQKGHAAPTRVKSQTAASAESEDIYRRTLERHKQQN
jgi:ribosomal protein S1